ncbi:MAG: hypothetical protein ACRBFS_26145 [Aureispira sp.]
MFFSIDLSFAKGFYLGLSDGIDFMAIVNAGCVMVVGEYPKNQLLLEPCIGGIVVG